MGSGASSIPEASPAEQLSKATVEEVTAVLSCLPTPQRLRIKEVVGAAAGPSSSAVVTKTKKNVAFVFIKPNALTETFKDLVLKRFASVGNDGMKILAEGSLTGQEIDEKKLVDQHYYAIASKATLMKPSELNVPEDKFKNFFGEDWSDVLSSGRAFNAIDAMAHLGIDFARLDELWQAAMKGSNTWTKLGGGFQCGKLQVDDKEPIFTFNGFFMSMRAKFTQPGPSIHYYVVEWDAKDLSWSDFRNNFLGATDPTAAPTESLRGVLVKDWEALGLKGKPWIGENGIHASASPFEALVERCNWLAQPLSEDIFGSQLLDAGISEEMLEAWRLDPQVVIAKGGRGGLFDQLEDLDMEDCISKCVELAKLQK